MPLLNIILTDTTMLRKLLGNNDIIQCHNVIQLLGTLFDLKIPIAFFCLQGKYVDVLITILIFCHTV